MRKQLTMSCLAAMLAFSGAGLFAPAAALAQQSAVDADHADLLDRIDEVEGKVADAQANGDVTRTEASKMRQELKAMRKNVRKVTRKQGFLSAAESSTYNRNLDAIENEL